MKIKERYCILDIETWNCGRDSVDPTKDLLRYVGFKAGDKKVMYHYTQTREIQKCIDYFDYFVGHNIKEFDKIVLERYGFKFDYKKVFVDTMVIAIKRIKSMMYIDVSEKNNKLGYLCDLFNLPNKKGEYDYTKLEKELFEGEELEELREYLYGDLDANDALFQFFYWFFYGFKDMVSEKNQLNMRWLTSASGTTAYMVICNQLGLKEEYTDTEEKSNKIQGAFVLQPTQNFCKGRVEYRDASSLYPHVYCMGNLFSHVDKNDPEGWNGGGLFPSVYVNEYDGIKGTYSRTPGKMELFLKYIYDERVKIKKELKQHKVGSSEYVNLDRKQLAYKILLNSSYGACNNISFKNIYNEVTASDCTAMARRVTKYAKVVLEENGYTILYIDTDGIFVHDVFNDPEKLNNVFEYIREQELKSANVRIESHGFKIETVIKCIWFFKNDKDELNKKSYIYVDENDEIHEKGIRVVRGDCSPIAKTVFDKHIRPLISEMKEFDVTEEQVTQWVKDEILINPEQLKKRYRLKDPSSYKVPEGKDESTALYYRLSKKYGRGEIYLVVNRRLGPGKDNHYCTLEELQEKYEDWVDQVKIESYVNDLRFLLNEKKKPTKRKKVKDNA